jgi:hypothetical protein
MIAPQNYPSRETYNLNTKIFSWLLAHSLNIQLAIFLSGTKFDYADKKMQDKLHPSYAVAERRERSMRGTLTDTVRYPRKFAGPIPAYSRLSHCIIRQNGTNLCSQTCTLRQTIRASALIATSKHRWRKWDFSNTFACQ